MKPYSPDTYPPVGQIAVIDTAERIQVWPNESERDDCFTGLLLKTGGNRAARVVHDLSVLWLRSAIIGIEEPTPADERLYLEGYF